MVKVVEVVRHVAHSHRNQYQEDKIATMMGLQGRRRRKRRCCSGSLRRPDMSWSTLH